MERHEVMRRALAGAAKVAFSAALVGCGGVTIAPGSDGSDGGGGETSGTGGTGATGAVTVTSGVTASVTSSQAATSSSSGVETACGVESAPPYSDHTVDCCVGMLTREFPPDGQTIPQPPTATPDLVACCDVGLAVYDHAVTQPRPDPTSPIPWQSVYPCCGIEGVHQTEPFSPACSPWGPPAPPAMIAGLEWVSEAA